MWARSGRGEWGGAGRASGSRLTYAEDDDEDDEGVHHGEEGGGDGGDHLGQLPHPAEEPRDAERADQPHQPVRDAEGPEVEDGHEDDGGVEPVPPVADEAVQPVCEEVDGQLDGEEGGEGVVDLEDQRVEPGGLVRFVLRVHHAEQEVLPRLVHKGMPTGL